MGAGGQGKAGLGRSGPSAPHRPLRDEAHVQDEGDLEGSRVCGQEGAVLVEGHALFPRFRPTLGHQVRREDRLPLQGPRVYREDGRFVQR